LPNPGHRLKSEPRGAEIESVHTLSTSTRRLAALLASLGCCGAILLSGGLVGAQAKAAEAGVVLNDTSAPALQALSSLGTHWVRVFAKWPDLEPQRGVYAPNWIESYVHLFKQLGRRTKVIVDMVGTPQWETGSSNDHTPPANDQEFADFVATMARDWAGKVAAYEIWNEEDSPSWWVGAPDPVGYTQLLQATYRAVKAVEPNTMVVLGGLTGNDYDFLEGVYDAGGKGYFDAVAVHTDTACNTLSPYTYLRDIDNRIDPDAFLGFREIHALMRAHGDDKPIWLTEMSWRTTAATCSEGAWAGKKPEGVDEQQQATYLSQAYHCLAQYPYVQLALWFPLSDDEGVTSGLIRADHSRKPAFDAMREYAHKGDALTEPCGIFTGPQIAVSSPTDRFAYSGPLMIHVSAKSPEGVMRITLEIDGKLIRHYTSNAMPTTLSGTLEWQGAKHIPLGRHTLTFIAYDKLRNTTSRSLTIYHVSGSGHLGGLASVGSAGGGHKRKHHHKRHKRKHHKSKRH
jgi:hypothetical protein